MKTLLPLLSQADLSLPLAWVDGEPVSAGRFVAEAEALAERLPAEGSPVNLCQDRYHFALGLAAALLRSQTSLMPPNALPETLASLGDAGNAYALVDAAGDAETGGLRRVAVSRAAGVGSARAVPAIAADLEAVRLLTSGSTGAPQPHAKRWGPLVDNIAAEAARLAELMGWSSLHGLAVVATVPAQHSYGFESSVMLGLRGGVAFESGRPFYPADIAAALAAVPAPRALVTTPFHLKTLLRAGVALPPTALVLSATAPLSPQLAAEAEAAFAGRVIEIYGCTEAGQVAARRTTEGAVWTTLGALRLHHERGHDGGERFVVAGGHVVEPTPLADVLELIDDRRFKLLGRANDLIHVAGKRSSLAHLNFHLNRVDGVDDGAFWMPDEVPGEVVRPVALVVAPRLTAGDVIAALRAHLEPAFVPRRVVHVDALPREATGKLTASALAALAQRHLGGPLPVADDECIVAVDHPAFDGHFPGAPVLPGAALLSLVFDAIDARPALRARLGAAPDIEQVKFLAPVRPGARLRFAFEDTARGVAFEVRCDGVVAARGELGGGRS